MSVELYNWHEVGFNPTFDVKAMTVAQWRKTTTHGIDPVFRSKQLERIEERIEKLMALEQPTRSSGW